MKLFHPTTRWSFYRSNQNVSFSNPMRRWFYCYLFLGAAGACGSYTAFRYQAAAWEARNHPDEGNWLCSDGMVDLLRYLPFNLASNAAGQLSENLSVPAWVHRGFIRGVVWWYDIDLSESQQTKDFDTFQDFYTREWRPEARPVDTAAAVVSPCDGQILAIHPHVQGTSLVQVKGLKFGLHALLHDTPPPLDQETHRRVAVVLHLRSRDFHHVVAPTSLWWEKSIYIPGSLLPATAAGYHAIPSILATNERLILRGTATDAAGGRVYLVLVGSTLTGRIKLALDDRVRTNFLDPPLYAVHRLYASKPSLERGERVASFQWGSSVVLLMDLPKTCTALKHVGDEVKAGEALFTS